MPVLILCWGCTAVVFWDHLIIVAFAVFMIGLRRVTGAVFWGPSHHRWCRRAWTLWS